MNALTIREYNVPAHLDIENDIKEKKNGQITFTVRVNAGNIVDYNLVEYVDARTKYISFARVVEVELVTTRHTGSGSSPDPLRDNYL